MDVVGLWVAIGHGAMANEYLWPGKSMQKLHTLEVNYLILLELVIKGTNTPQRCKGPAWSWIFGPLGIPNGWPELSAWYGLVTLVSTLAKLLLTSGCATPKPHGTRALRLTPCHVLCPRLVVGHRGHGEELQPVRVEHLRRPKD